MAKPEHLALLHRPQPLHRLPGVRAGLQRVRHAPRRLDDPPGVRRPRALACRRCRSCACTASSRPAPRSARPTRSSAPATASCSRARKPRCIACGNCVVACPFGVPEVYEDRQIMMKCDMCYDRTSVGKKPMCATVCPSQALFFGTREEIEQLRPLSTPVNTFQFGAADDHDAGVHDGAARSGGARAAGRRHGGDGRGSPAGSRGVPARARLGRPVRRGGGVSHGRRPAIRRHAASTASDSPARRADRHRAADVYARATRSRSRSRRTAGRRRSSRPGGRTSRSTGRRTTTSRAATSRSSWC